MSVLRRDHGGDWQRGTAFSGYDPRSGKDPRGLVLYICLQALQGRKHRDAGGKDGEACSRYFRKLCLSRGHCPYHGAEVCHGQPAVPAGAGVEPAGRENFPADHVQLDIAGSGRLAEAGVQGAAQTAGTA